MKKLLGRATRCPECGERACSWVARSASSTTGKTVYCAHCGCPCRTPTAVFAATLIGGALVQYAAERTGWEPASPRGWAIPFTYGCLILNAVLLWLVPLRPSPGETRTVWAKADVKKTIPCSAGRVFCTACNYYGGAYGFEIEGRDEEQRVLWVRQEKVKYLVEDNERKWECFCLSFTEAGPDRCEVRVSLGNEESWDYNQRQVVKLNEVCQKLESLLGVKL